MWQGRARPDFDRPLELEVGEEEVLSLDPADGGCELVGEKLNEDDVSKLLR